MISIVNMNYRWIKVPTNTRSEMVLEDDDYGLKPGYAQKRRSLSLPYAGLCFTQCEFQLPLFAEVSNYRGFPY